MKLRIWVALASVYVVWGSTYLAIRFAVETIPPFLMAATRFLTAGLILLIWRRLAGDPWPRRCHWRSAAIVGLLLLLGGNGGVVWAEQRVASGVAALLVGSAPLWMAVLDAARPGGARLGWKAWMGVFAGLAGIALLISPGGEGAGGLAFDAAGVAALLLASLLWSVGSLFSRSAPLPDSPLMGTAMEMLVGGLGLLTASALTGEWVRFDVSQVSARSLGGLAYLIVFGALVGFVAYTWLLRNAPTTLVSTYAFVNPLVAVVLGALLAQETLAARMIAAAGFIVIAVAFINFSRSANPPAPVHVTNCGDD